MSANSYPRDALGAEIRKGSYVLDKQSGIVWQVVEVEPAMDLTDGNGGSLPTTGKIVMQSSTLVQFPAGAVAGNLYVLKGPPLVEVPGARLKPEIVRQ